MRHVEIRHWRTRDRKVAGRSRPPPPRYDRPSVTGRNGNTRVMNNITACQRFSFLGSEARFHVRRVGSTSVMTDAHGFTRGGGRAFCPLHQIETE